MSWKTKSYLNRVFNAFKRNKDKIYPEDIEALKNLSESIEEHSKQVAKDNLMYAKVLLILIRQNAYYHNGAKMALKSIQKELRHPMQYHLDLLTRELNEIEQRKFLNSKNVDTSHGHTKKKLNELELKEFEEKIKEQWTIDIVEKSFYSSANDFLKDFENYT